MLEPIPDMLVDEYDNDAIVYSNDTSFYYNKGVPKEIINDISNHTIQIYSGYYEFMRGWPSPKIYLIGRGLESGKFKLKIQGFLPYCYVLSDKGDMKSYLEDKVEKMSFKGMHPETVANFRKIRLKQGYPAPYESDILFVRRFLIDTYDFFKPKEPILPRIAILDIETDFPVTNNIISFAINDMKDDFYYESKFDTQYPSELALSVLHKIKEYDIITGWNIDFDIGILYNSDRKVKVPQILEIIDKHLNFARIGYKYTKEEYINSMLKGHFYFGEDETRNLIDLLIQHEYLKEDNGILVIGKIFDPNVYHYVAIMDSLVLSKKMYAQEIKGKWSLDNIGTQLAGIDKIHIGSKQIRDLSKDELLEYNCRDAIIPEIIDNMLGGLEAHLILAWSLHSLLEDMKITAVVNDIALLRAYHKQGIVLPTRDFSEKADEPKYKAAEPDARPGIYDGIIATDLVHAYPFAVISKNVSPETKDPNGVNIAPNGIRFNDNKSVFIDTLKDLMEDRKKVKTKLKTLSKDDPEYKKYKYIDFALKTQTAAFSHGIFGWANSRMRDYEVADAITSIVRNLINILKEACDVIDKQWVYLHTDSIFVNSDEVDINGVVGYLNDILKDYCEEYKVMPELEFKGYYPIAYIHTPARNILVPKDGNLDDVNTWEITGMNFIRSEVPVELVDIEVELIKLKLKRSPQEDLENKLRERISKLSSVDSTRLGVIKPLTKKIEEYARSLKDGTIGGYPNHIKALLRAKDEYDFNVVIGDKFMVLPIITDETVGKKKVKRKRVDIAFPIETGLPNSYKIDYESYLRGNLFGKIHELFNLNKNELEEKILTEEVKKELYKNMEENYV